MSRVIDAFLFFQELELLEVRLEYLAPCVDTFVIVEAAQTFTGRPKPFVFPQHAARFARFASKIVYYPVADTHADYAALRQFLTTAPDEGHRRILALLEAHTHYPKDELRWVLDSYHRECLHLPLAAIAQPDDIVLISDLDEIPVRSVFAGGAAATAGERPTVCQQHEFRYFANFYRDSDWLGTMFAPYRALATASFNELRVDAKTERRRVDPRPVANAGWHFTSCGDVEAIRRKIESWGHQEFNTPAVMDRLSYNIRTGQDIFLREHGTVLQQVAVEPGRYFDEAMAAALRRHPTLINDAPIEVVPRRAVRQAALRARHYLRRAAEKIARLARRTWRR